MFPPNANPVVAEPAGALFVAPSVVIAPVPVAGVVEDAAPKPVLPKENPVLVLFAALPPSEKPPVLVPVPPAPKPVFAVFPALALKEKPPPVDAFVFVDAAPPKALPVVMPPPAAADPFPPNEKPVELIGMVRFASSGTEWSKRLFQKREQTRGYFWNYV